MTYGKSAIALDESAICSRWFSSKDMLCSSSAGEVVCLWCMVTAKPSVLSLVSVLALSLLLFAKRSTQ